MPKVVVSKRDGLLVAFAEASRGPGYLPSGGARLESYHKPVTLANRSTVRRHKARRLGPVTQSTALAERPSRVPSAAGRLGLPSEAAHHN